jgi:hypothetical protein
MKTKKSMKVKELIEKLSKVNPEADIRIYFNTEIWGITELGGNSFLGKNYVWIIPAER